MGLHKILIVEDDVQIAESLSDMLEILDHEVVDIASSYDEAVKVLREKDVDLALLDIQINGDKSGIDIAERIKVDFHVPFIFTTAYADKETIKKASVHSPYGYIVKPYGMKDINAGIEVAIQNHKNLKEISTNAAAGEQTAVMNSESLFVKTNSRIVRINMEDIIYIEARGDYAVFKTDEKGYIVSTTIKNVEEKLDSNIFVKVHRSYIVNVNKVVDIEENNLLIDEQVIPISRSQKPNLLKRLNMI